MKKLITFLKCVKQTRDASAAQAHLAFIVLEISTFLRTDTHGRTCKSSSTWVETFPSTYSTLPFTLRLTGIINH